jgi:hypothetical protein
MLLTIVDRISTGITDSLPHFSKQVDMHGSVLAGACSLKIQADKKAMSPCSGTLARKSSSRPHSLCLEILYIRYFITHSAARLYPLVLGPSIAYPALADSYIKPRAALIVSHTCVS